MGCQSSKQAVNIMSPKEEKKETSATIRFQNKHNSEWTEDHSRTKLKIIEKYHNISPSNLGVPLQTIHEENSSILSSKMYAEFGKESDYREVRSPKKRIGKVV